MLKPISITFAFMLILGTYGAAFVKAYAQTPPAPQVTIAMPLQQEITEWDEFTGRFEAVENVDVRARVSGVISDIHFRDGELVKKGDLLFTVDKRPFQIAVEQAKATLNEAIAGRELQENEVRRAEPLLERGNLPRSEYEARLARKLQAEARVELARAMLRAAELNLEWTEVKSPIAGRISDARVDIGNLIAGGQANATLLTKIVSLDPINFVFFGSEADFLKYSRLSSTGQRESSRDKANPVAVRLADEKNFKHEGTMSFVDNELDPNSGTIKVRATFENKSLFLAPGVFGRLRLFGGKSNAFLIPDAAISSDQASKIVFVVDDEDKVNAKVVTLGPIVDGLRVIRSGLDANDRIIIAGIQRARTGQKVTPVEGKIEAKPNIN